jgi:hypothetical protein
MWLESALMIALQAKGIWIPILGQGLVYLGKPNADNSKIIFSLFEHWI